jgi:mono/diheme cytochrome c family protein
MKNHKLIVTAVAAGVALAWFLPIGTRVSQAQTAPIAGSAAGANVYAGNCAACHQENGVGVAGAFPPLAGHVADVLAQPGGRNYLIRAVLFGVEGTISVSGASFNGAMPAWNTLDDQAIASALNHIATSWGNAQRLPAGFKAWEANEIAAVRAERMTAAAVYALRQKLFASSAQAVASPATTPVSFTEQQVTQGKAAYQQNCMDCHGSSLDNGEFGGAPLKGAYFRNKWGNGSVANLYAFTKAKMPPDRPGTFSDKVYADLVAFILQANGYEPGGRELPADATAQQSMTLKRD